VRAESNLVLLGKLINSSLFSVAKLGVMGLTFGNAKELARWGIRCMCIQPGGMDTPGL
jgi:NAD(P)-dependent dehydrogenase (short-subunit alcohol dehydrogenase family)